MIINPESSKLQPLTQTYNQDLFTITAKLDKLLFLIVGCGFTINSLVAEPDNNQFVETVSHLIQKFKFFVDATESVSASTDLGQDKEMFAEILVGQVKNFIKALCKLQEGEPFLMFNSIDQYLQVLARVLHRAELYPERTQKLAMLAIYKVVNVDLLNQGDRDGSGHTDGTGILFSPIKYKNLEPQISKAGELYRQVMQVPLPQSDLPHEQTRQDGARKILELVTQ